MFYYIFFLSLLISIVSIFSRKEINFKIPTFVVIGMLFDLYHIFSSDSGNLAPEPSLAFHVWIKFAIPFRIELHIFITLKFGPMFAHFLSYCKRQQTKLPIFLKCRQLIGWSGPWPFTFNYLKKESIISITSVLFSSFVRPHFPFSE